MNLSGLLKGIWFLIYDFDNCLAQTFESSPRNIDVVTAYNHALLQLFGQDFFGAYAKNPLSAINGLANRTPTEIITALLTHTEKAGQHSQVIDKIKSAFFSHQDLWDGQVPTGKGVPLIWDESDQNLDMLPVAAEMLTRLKLSVLLKEIGPEWPLPCPGVIDFFQKLPELQEKSGLTLVTGILSSGHEVFIRRTFETWGVPIPDFMVTDDDVRGLRYTLAKPDPSLFHMVHAQWLSRQVQEENAPAEDDRRTILKKFLAEALERTTYFGDDKVKDGLMAKKGKVHNFGWYNQNDDTAHNLGKHFCFKDWRDVPKILGWD